MKGGIYDVLAFLIAFLKFTFTFPWPPSHKGEYDAEHHTIRVSGVSATQADVSGEAQAEQSSHDPPDESE